MEFPQLIKISFYTLILSTFFACLKKNVKPINSSKIKEFSNYYDSSENSNLPISSRIQSINKAYEITKTLKIDTLSLKTLKYKASLLTKANKPIEYYKTSRLYLNMALITKNTEAIGDAYFKIGNYYFIENKPDSAYYYFNKSKIVFTELNDSLSIARRLLNMAIIQSNESDFYGSEKTAVEALKYLNYSNKKQLISVYNCLAITTSAVKNYDDALYWTNKSQSIQNNDLNYSVLQNNKAGYLIKKQEYAEAERILTSLLINKRTTNFHKLNANVKSNLGYIYLKKNKIKKALPLLKESLLFSKENNNTYKVIESYRRLSELYETKNDLQKAQLYADSAHTSSLQKSNLFEKVTTLKRTLKFATGDHYKKISEQYISWNDSLQNKITTNRDLFVKIKYDTEKTRSENLLLNTKITQHDLKIAKETYRRNLGILISSLLIISVGFILSYWRQRIKIASLNAITKTENRISKKVHDEMANDISNIKTVVQNSISTNTPIKEQLLNMLDISYTKARDIAAETGEIIFGESFSSDLKNLLMQHNNDTIKIVMSISALDQLSINQRQKNAIYRTLQELLVNMNKHSNATRVIIAHKKEGKLNEIKYTDNGIGSADIKKHNGLHNATTRMKDINGSFSFETSKGNGFKAILKFKA